MADVADGRSDVTKRPAVTIKPNPRLVGNLEGSERDKKKAQQALRSGRYDITLRPPSAR